LAKIGSYLIKLVNTLSKPGNKGFLIIDFTLIPKMFASIMEKLTRDFNGVEKRVDQGLSMGFAVWVDPINKWIIPLINEAWLSKKIAHELYVKKTIITQKIILKLKNIVPFELLCFDGAFANLPMFDFLEANQLKYLMRVLKNRVVSNENATNQLAQHPDLILHKNRKFKTISATFKGHTLFFTAQKRKKKNGKKEVVFLVSNLPQAARDYVKMYKIRWKVEKFFRTAKQSLGLGHCQSISFDKQQAHISIVMLTYAHLQILQKFKQAENLEPIVKKIRFQKHSLHDLQKALIC